MKFLQNIFSIGNVNYHKVITILGLKIKFKSKVNFFKQNRDKYEMFYKRNLLRNAVIQVEGLRRLKRKNISFHIEDEYKAFYLLREKIDYYLLNRINMPQIEFTLTTKCTLRCKNCTNYIPKLEHNEHSIMEFEDFKEYVDNLCKAVHKIYHFQLIGGETLLVKDLHKYLEYTAKKKQIKRVWIVTNGTLLLNDELIEMIKKYRKKTTVLLSNYSRNPELKDRLKHEKILEQIKSTKAQLIYDEDLDWTYVSEDFYEHGRTKNENINYYKKCIHPCIAVFKDMIFPCPRAGVFYLKNKYHFDENIRWGGGICFA